MTGSDGILRNTAVLAVARMAERLSNAVIAFLIARRLGLDGLGVYSTAIAVYQVVVIGGELGVTNFIVREIARDRRCTGPYVVHLSAVVAAVGGVLTAASFGIVPVIYSGTLRDAVLIALLAILPAALNTIQEGVFLAHQRTEFETGVTLVAGVLNVIACAVLLMRGAGVVSLLIVFVVLEYAATFTYYWLIRRYIAALPWAFDRRLAWSLVRAMRAFVGSSVLGALTARPEILILSLISTTTAVGYYSGALKIVDVFFFVPQVFMMNVFPVLSRAAKQADGSSQVTQDRAIRALLVVSLPIGAVTAITAYAAVDVLYGPSFHQAGRVLTILAWNVTLYSLFAVFWRVLAARGEQGAVLRVQMLTTITRIGGGFLLIGALGAIGAAINAVASLVLQSVLLAGRVRRDGTRIPLLKLAWRPMLASLGAGAGALVGLRLAGLYGGIAGGAVTYAVLALALRVVTLEELAALRPPRASAS